MRHVFIILFILTGLVGNCFAADEGSANSGDSTAQPAAPAPEGDNDKTKPAEEEAEPDCE